MGLVSSVVMRSVRLTAVTGARCCITSVWCRGEHPDRGLDYSARNSLTEAQCLQEPCRLLGTPICSTSYFHCQQFQCIQTSQPCKKYCGLLGTC